MKTAILGGGLTGVTLARLLSERGEEVVVLEAGTEYGGLCRSRIAGGFTFDTGGSHIIFSRDEEVLSFMKGVLGQNRTERHRTTKIFYKGRYVKYPFENGLSDLPDEDRFFCINEFIHNLIAVEKGEVDAPGNFRDWIYATFGRGIAECYMVPYNRKIWNCPPEEMSAHWMEGRVPRPPVEDVIRSAIGIETEGYTHQSVFSYPQEGGIEALVQAIAAPIEDSIRTGFTVRSVRRMDGGWVIGNGEEEVRADRCISTIPLQSLLPCLAGVPDEVSRACSALRYNSVACVCIGIRGEVPPYSWVYVPSEEIGEFNRISFPSGYSDTNAPAGCTSVLAEITYREGDPAETMSDQALIDHTIQGLIRMGVLGDQEEVVHTAVERQQYAYVIYDTAYLENIRVVREWCRDEGIDLVGRFSEFEYLNMDGCIRHALDYVGASR
ncbi:protoporphyrinogen/coproporphyrinogen oxidase [Methanofollis fontis]|uniref:FAD-dependent oxidoreductase n=1 Tax=Methanofollis fontis TaxID=2052832 RepID=A0A483CNV5_9EURY|nr:FAD-dependent oxidoreductase [Methanofollis fontis]TAJ44742.1 FAD-dependent oxidoreductase [Methanofollis fontis]